MDGNGRWAESRGLSRQEGHRAGAENLRTVIERFGQHDVPMLTLFAFSTENWGRPRAEVDGIMRLAGRTIDREMNSLHEASVRLRHLGDLDGLPTGLQKRVRAAVERTAGNSGMTVNLAFNYGGRADIVTAVRALVAAGATPEQITEEAISAHLTTAGQPDPDLIIRTGGEHRISNFLVWQAAYCEYHFTTTAWPNFGPAEVDAALIEFSRRRRRFGLVPEDSGASG
ncbi:MAG: di-trans,poly-cis-decaprenylcistransferase [Dehalococcoidia bacterium]|nr:di-trans,poly-cis-decaprenylcistransferase [Dehalococcoidia bacterium]